MKETVTVYRFLHIFQGSNTYQNHFSHDGLIALFEYIEQVEDDIGEEFELDVVGICCDYTEYDSLEEFNGAMNYLSDDKIYTLDDIREETVVIEIPETERFITGEF